MWAYYRLDKLREDFEMERWIIHVEKLWYFSLPVNMSFGGRLNGELLGTRD